MVALRAPLAAAVRMIDRVHRDAAHARPPSAPARPSGLPVRDVLVLEVADLADRRPAGEADAAELAGRQLEQRVVAFLRHQLDRRAGAPAELSAAAFAQLDVVHHRAERDVGERQAVTRFDVRARTRLDPVADREAGRGEDVALLTVGVVEERDARRPVRIVLDRRDGRGHAVLVALEVDDPVEALVAATAVAGRDAAEVVPSARLVERRRERGLGRRLRDLGEVVAALEAAAGRRRAVGHGRHRQAPSKKSIRLPSASVTYAFFQSGRRPWCRPTRRTLPSCRLVRTFSTRTLKSASMAWRISTLFACGWTRNTTVLPCSCTSVPFSVMIGPCTTCSGAISPNPVGQ